jgi:prepilin-type N-terminal cleavage/methylation domain-containing protein
MRAIAVKKSEWYALQGRGRAVAAGFTLTELMAVLALLGILTALVVPRVVGHHDAAKCVACEANQAEIELQAKLWRRHHGAYPSANLSDIATDVGYFPAGLPVCPVDGSAYTITTTDGRVIGHTH